jgi:hypothetical protein
VSGPGIDKATAAPLDQMVQSVTEQAVSVARQEVALARRELAAKARQASSGAAMVGGAALLGTLAAGTGTASLVLFLSGRRGPSAAALGVTGLYAGLGVQLGQEGIARLRAAAPPVPEETVGNVKQNLGSGKKRASAKNRASAKTAQTARRKGPQSRGRPKAPRSPKP